MAKKKENPPTDNCMHCEATYELTAENAAVQTFLRNPECNYLNATCTACNGVTRIFLELDTVCQLVEKLPIYVYSDAPEEIIEGAKKLGIIEEPIVQLEVVLEELPELPPHLRRELFDYFRDFDHGRD